MDESDLAHSMYKAIYDGKSAKVKTLLKNGCSADLILDGSSRLTALIFATVQGKLDIVKILIEFKAPLNFKDAHEMTALMHACVKNYSDILRCLVHSGADVNIVDKGGKSAFLHAARWGSLECLEYLIKYPAVNLNHVDLEGKSALFLAACGTDIRIIQFLLDHQLDKNRCDVFGNSPLSEAIYLSKIPSALALLDCDVEVNTINNEGKTPLTKTMEQVRNETMLPVVKKLLDCGSNPSYAPCDETYLHEMIARGHMDIVRKMIINGCTPRLHHCDDSIFKFIISEQISPLAVALLTNQHRIARYFLAISFLTQYDINRLPYNVEVLKHLNSEGYDLCKSLLTNFSSSPFPLLSLSLITLSKLYNNCNNAVKNYILHHLPKALIRKLQFQSDLVHLCIHEWDTIPLMIEPCQVFPRTQPLLEFWPVGHSIEECKLHVHDGGYKVIKNYQE